MSNFNIRFAGEQDLESIYDIDQNYDYEKYSKDMILASLKNERHCNMILRIGEIDVGYLSAMLLLDECELLKIVVKKEYRAKGYGKELLNNLKEYCLHNNIDKIFLEVRSDNEVAKSLYIKNGFDFNGVRKGYYNGIDAEIYWCKINDKIY